VSSIRVFHVNRHIYIYIISKIRKMQSRVCKEIDDIIRCILSMSIFKESEYARRNIFKSEEPFLRMNKLTHRMRP